MIKTYSYCSFFLRNIVCNNHREGSLVILQVELLLCVLIQQSDSLLAQIQNRGKLIAITSYNSTNYFIHQGEPLGYQYELLHSLADKLGVNLDIIVENDVNKSVEMLNNGKADIIARDIAITTANAPRK